MLFSTESIAFTMSFVDYVAFQKAAPMIPVHILLHKYILHTWLLRYVFCYIFHVYLFVYSANDRVMNTDEYHCFVEEETYSYLQYDVECRMLIEYLKEEYVTRILK